MDDGYVQHWRRASKSVFLPEPGRSNVEASWTFALEADFELLDPGYFYAVLSC